MKLKFRKPSAGTTIATIALFIALTSTAYAASLPKNSVGNKQIKKNAVTGVKIKSGEVRSSDVRDNSLTGTDVDEATLGTVPSAQAATTVGGASIKALKYGGASNSADVVIYDANGLKLTASCPAGTPTLIATTTVEDSAIRVGLNTLSSLATSNDGTKSTYDEDDSFDVGDNFGMLVGTNMVASNVNDSSQATFTYASPSGGVVTGTFLAEDDANFVGNPGTCHIYGHAVG